jgi:hypothetical protein
MNKEYFIRTKGKYEFKTYHLICLNDFTMLDMFFNSELETKQYAEKNSLKIVDYKENFKE